MPHYSFGRGLGCFLLCFFLGLMWSGAVLPVWGFLTLLLHRNWLAYNSGCVALISIGISAVVKVASRSVHAGREEAAFNRIDARLSSLSFALACALVYLIIWSCISNSNFVL